MSTAILITILIALLFLSIVLNVHLIITILAQACEFDEDETSFPKCTCNDVNNCDTYCIGKKNYHEKHP